MAHANNYRIYRLSNGKIRFCYYTEGKMFVEIFQNWECFAAWRKAVKAGV